jgi:hypothetical protein
LARSTCRHCWDVAIRFKAGQKENPAAVGSGDGLMRIFISHASEDSEAAGELARAIASRGHDVIARDSSAEALRSADAMVVLVSGRSVESPFVRREIEFALETPRFADRLIPVLIETTSGAPWILRKFKSFPAGADLAQTGQRVAEALESTT